MGTCRWRSLAGPAVGSAGRYGGPTVAHPALSPNSPASTSPPDTAGVLFVGEKSPEGRQLAVDAEHSCDIMSIIVGCAVVKLPCKHWEPLLVKQLREVQGSAAPIEHDAWNSLYTTGGCAALLCALMYLIAMGIYVPAYRSGPPPGTILEWFTLLHANPLTGLFFLGLADVVIMIFWGPMSLALYMALKQANKTWSLIAVTFVFVGIAVYLATNMAFSLLSLSHQYAAATTEAEKSLALAAGQAMLAASRGTGGQYVGMPLAWLAGLIFSIIMLRSQAFGKTTARVGILGLGLLVASVPFAGYTTAAPGGAVVSAIIGVTYIGGGLLSLAWYVLVGLRLLKLGRLAGKM